MVNADRISEVYKGEIWDTALQERARRRVDWLAGHARGEVLDVGCSQGITSLVAARGHADVRVIGIDNELDRVAYADADRAAEPADVAHRVAFLGGSADALPFGGERFDVVLLGEVLEHLEKPDAVLAEVARVLRPGGVVAITVPFGLSPHHDHRETFYAANLLALVSAHLAPVSIDVVERYLRLTAVPGRADAQQIAALVAGVQPTADRVLLDVERAELAARGELRELEKQAHQLATRTRQLAERDQEITRLRGALTRVQRRLEVAAARQADLRHQRDEYRWKFSSLRSRRSMRALAEVRRGLGGPKALAALPLRLVRVLFGPAPERSAPPQRVERPGRAAGDPKVAAQRRGLELTMKMLAPPPAVTLRDLRVAGLLDAFSEASFGPECELVTFRPDDWEAVLERQPPHLLFVESAWQGTGGAWQYQVGTYAHAESVGLPHLSRLVEWCRQRSIPTVFWNKEDPVHFDKFKQAAQLFDVVLTTDADSVERYRRLAKLRAGVVEALPFAAQPRLHHPVTATGEREAVPVFGGTYYRNRHPERRAQLELLLDAARASGLVIFDRTFGTDAAGVGFPERFVPHVRGGLPYHEMVEAYRRYRLFLNANSVSASPTMFSRRVFELLACGTPVVSTPSVGMEALFGDIVVAVDDPDAARAAIATLLHDDDAWRERSAAGIRRVHGQHTYAHRLSRLAGLAGFDIAPYGDERIAVLLLDDGATASTLDSVISQSERPHDLIVGTSGQGSGGRQQAGGWASERDHGPPTGVTAIAQAPDRPRVERLAELAAATDAPWVLIAAAGQTYDLDHVADLAVARRWTTADVIGVGADGDRLDGPPAHRYVRRVAPHGALVRRDLVVRHGWDDRDGAALQGRLGALGASFYAVRA